MHPEAGKYCNNQIKIRNVESVATSLKIIFICTCTMEVEKH